MVRRVFMLCAGVLLITSAVQSQSYRSTVNEGNEYYNQQQYDEAREKYEQAAVSEPERPESYFNQGNAAYRSDDIKAAIEQYEKAGTRVRSKEELARTLYNAGNTFLNAADKGVENPALQQAAAAQGAGSQGAELRMEGYRKAIDLYKQTLKLDPRDADARYNLTYARKKLEDLQKQQQNQNQDEQQKKDQKQDKDKDDQQQDKNKQDEQNKKDKQDEQQQKQQNQKDKDQKENAKPDEQQQSKPEKQKTMSKQQAEQILRALERDEKDLQKKKRQKTNVRVSVEKDW